MTEGLYFRNFLKQPDVELGDMDFTTQDQEFVENVFLNDSVTLTEVVMLMEENRQIILRICKRIFKYMARSEQNDHDNAVADPVDPIMQLSEAQKALLKPPKPFRSKWFN